MYANADFDGCRSFKAPKERNRGTSSKTQGMYLKSYVKLMHLEPKKPYTCGHRTLKVNTWMKMFCT